MQTNYLLIQIKRSISFLIHNISIIQTVALTLIISPNNSAKNLGVVFQLDMCMDKHISAIVKSCFLQLRDCYLIRPLISKTDAITLANTLVLSHLDYCNSLFYGLPKYSYSPPTKIQNTTVRIVTTRISCFTHITPILKSLQWLPVYYRITFKIFCLTHRAISLGEPYYLRFLLSNMLNSHSLRSSSFNPLVVPCLKKVYNVIRSFSYAAPFL